MNFDLEGGGHGAGEGDGRSSLHDRSSGNGRGGDGSRINWGREQGLMNTIAFHSAYLTFNGLLYMVIQINYQNQRNSPFKTYMVMKSSIVALCVYFYAAAWQTMLMQTNNELDDPRLLNHVLGCSGILSPLSNVLMFFPNMVGCIVVALFVFATTILLAYDVYKLISNCISERNNSENNYAATSEPVALEMSTGISHNAATSEPVALEMSTGISHNAATSESKEMSIGISHNTAATSDFTEMSTEINNNESSRNNNDAVEMRT